MMIHADRTMLRLLVAFATSICMLVFLATASQPQPSAGHGQAIASLVDGDHHGSGGSSGAAGPLGFSDEVPGHTHLDHHHDKAGVAVPVDGALRPSMVFGDMSVASMRADRPPGGIERPPRAVSRV